MVGTWKGIAEGYTFTHLHLYIYFVGYWTCIHKFISECRSDLKGWLDIMKPRRGKKNLVDLGSLIDKRSILVFQHNIGIRVDETEWEQWGSERKKEVGSEGEDGESEREKTYNRERNVRMKEWFGDETEEWRQIWGRLKTLRKQGKGERKEDLKERWWQRGRDEGREIRDEKESDERKTSRLIYISRDNGERERYRKLGGVVPQPNLHLYRV